MKKKSSSLDLPEESLAGSKRKESWVNKTTEEIQSAHKTEPSPSAAAFKPFRVNPVNPSFQPAISVLTSQLDEYNSDIRNSFQSSAEKIKIQKKTLNTFRTFRKCLINLLHEFLGRSWFFFRFFEPNWIKLYTINHRNIPRDLSFYQSLMCLSCIVMDVCLSSYYNSDEFNVRFCFYSIGCKFFTLILVIIIVLWTL